MRHPIAFFLTLLLTAVGLCGTAQATDPIDTDQTCSLYIQYAHEGQVYSGETVMLYRVAAVSEDGQYTTIDDFAPYPVGLNGLTDGESWNRAAADLAVYAAEAEVSPTLTAVVDPDGYARFHGVQPGLYLAASEQVTTCPFQGLLVTLPALHGQHRVYEVITAAKYDPALLVPPTGDEGNMYLLSLVLGMSGVGLLIVSGALRKRGL